MYPEDPDAGPEGVCRLVEDTIIRIKDTQVEGFDLNSADQQWSFETGDFELGPDLFALSHGNLPRMGGDDLLDNPQTKVRLLIHPHPRLDTSHSLRR